MTLVSRESRSTTSPGWKKILPNSIVRVPPCIHPTGLPSGPSWLAPIGGAMSGPGRNTLVVGGRGSLIIRQITTAW